jgi:hypothetical protein
MRQVTPDTVSAVKGCSISKDDRKKSIFSLTYLVYRELGMLIDQGRVCRLGAMV